MAAIPRRCPARIEIGSTPEPIPQQAGFGWASENCCATKRHEHKGGVGLRRFYRRPVADLIWRTSEMTFLHLNPRAVIPMRCVFFIASAAVVMTAPRATSAAPERVSFNAHIRPIFTKHCTACHGGVKQAGGLSFIYREQALGECDSGLRPIVPGDVEFLI